MQQLTCVLDASFGNRIFSARLADSVDRCRGAGRRLWFDATVFREHPAPPWLRRIAAYESEYVARRWLRAQSLQEPLIVNGYSLALAAGAHRMIVATDITPALLVRRSRGLASAWVHRTLSARFRGLAARVAAWLPMSGTVQHSLVEDYGVDPQRCYVTRAPQPIVDPQPHPASGALLFVGNDFARKGGPALLQAFERRLLPECRLTIVSNDASLNGLNLPQGVSLLAGVHDPAQLAGIYRKSDLLVLPTRQDCYSHVICEAAAYGIPSLATRVGGIGELLDESGGNSLPADCSAEDIAAAVRASLSGDYIARAQEAARFATQKLPLTVLDATVERALAHL